MELKMRIAEWIRAARTSAGMSGSELGAKLALELGELRGNTRANISHWETCKHEPSLQQIVAIVKITRQGLPEDVLSAMAGRKPHASIAAELAINTIPQIPRASVAMDVERARIEAAAITDIEAPARLTRLERLDSYECDLITASRECSPGDRNVLLDTAMELIPDRATVHMLFPRNKS